MHSKIVLILFIVVISVSIGQALKCFTCEKDACNITKDFPSTSKYCFAGLVDTLRTLFEGDKGRPARDCVDKSFLPGGKDCRQVIGIGGATFVCECSTDFCNDGNELEQRVKPRRKKKDEDHTENEENKRITWWIVAQGVALVLAFKSLIY